MSRILSDSCNGCRKSVIRDCFEATNNFEKRGCGRWNKKLHIKIQLLQQKSKNNDLEEPNEKVTYGNVKVIEHNKIKAAKSKRENENDLLYRLQN